MAARFVCTCGMAFTVAEVRPGRPVVCPVCGTAQEGRADASISVDAASPIGPAAPAAAPERATVRCPECGALNSADDVICGMCGERISVDLLGLAGETGPSEAGHLLSDDVDFLTDDLGVLASDEKPKREALRYEGEDYVPILRLVARMLIRPRREMETLVSFLSYRDMVWKLLGMFLLGVVGVWLAGVALGELPLVRRDTFGVEVRLRKDWDLWLGLAFLSVAFIAAGLTALSSISGLLTGHGWHLGPLALALLFVVSLVNIAHLLLVPVVWISPTLAHALAWGLLAWEVLLTIYVINRVLECEAVLAVIIALVLCAATGYFHGRAMKLTGRLVPGPTRGAIGAMMPQPPGGG